MTKQQYRPIFVVGCSRSGTTMLQKILSSHSHIACGPETHFLSSLREITSVHWYKTLGQYEYDQTYWYAKVRELFNSFKEEYALEAGKRRWAEKTPRYIMILDYIVKVFPNCQIIHIIRDGRDVVLSHKDRWGYKNAMNSINKWKNAIEFGQRIGTDLPTDQYYEIRYEDIINEPESTLKAMFEYLQEPWEEDVVDASNFKGRLEARRREESGEQQAFYKSSIGRGKKKLDPFLTALFFYRAGDLYRELGYE